MLDKASPIPLYYQLQNSIRDYIHSEGITPGDRLPSLNELANNYDVSLAVVRQAVQGLVQEGVVEAHQGRGLFVGSPKHKYSLDLLSPQFFEYAEQMGIELSIVAPVREVLPASEALAKRMEIPVGDPVIHALKIRYANAIPLELADAYFPYSICPDLVLPDLTSKQLSNLLEEKIYHKITKSNTWASAKAADEEEARLLKIEVGDPLLVFEGLSRNAEGKPVQSYIASVVSSRLRMGVNIEQLELVF